MGFAITIVSIETLNHLVLRWDWRWVYLSLAPGPLLGLWALVHRPGIRTS
ncbi:MAG: hypothetical protein KDC57_11405 [Saprospiraceae bacterium]|nr:hypothetical protein [Saprospiraceae bacterium]